MSEPYIEDAPGIASATVRGIFQALAQDSQGADVPDAVALVGLSITLTPSPRKIEVAEGGIDGTWPMGATTYTLREWVLTTDSEGSLVNPAAPEPSDSGVKVVASDAFPGVTIEWLATINAPDAGVPTYSKRFLANGGTTVDLTTVESIPPSPSPLADYLQAVADARAARDAAQGWALEAGVQAGIATAQAAAAAGSAETAVRAAVDATTAAALALLSFDADAGEYEPASLAAWLLRQRDGLIYGVDIPRGLAVGCTKTGANAGIATPTPGVIGTPATDPYTGRGPFFTATVNGYVDPDGVPHVTAFEGDPTFSLTGENGDVWILAPVLYWRWDETDPDTISLLVSDVRRPGYEPQPKAILPSGTQRPYMLYAKYALSIDSAGMARSVSGARPQTRNVSHNSLITLCKNATTGYSGKSFADDWYVKVMFLLKYATKNSQSVFAGCTNYNIQTPITVAESSVTRVIIATSQANNIPIGSALMLGSATSTPDRGAAAAFAVFDGLRVVSREAYDGSNTAVELATPAPFTTTAGAYLSTAPWPTGSCDQVSGDGSPTSRLGGREPHTIQGIEIMLGMTETLGDVILSSNGASGWLANLVADSRQAATSVTASYEATGVAAPSGASAGWNYPLGPLRAGLGLLMGAPPAGASTSTGLCDGSYPSPTTDSGTRQWQSFGTLTSGESAGLWCVFGNLGLGSTGGGIGSRLSGVGRAG